MMKRRDGWIWKGSKNNRSVALQSTPCARPFRSCFSHVAPSSLIRSVSARPSVTSEHGSLLENQHSPFLSTLQRGGPQLLLLQSNKLFPPPHFNVHFSPTLPPQSAPHPLNPQNTAHSSHHFLLSSYISFVTLYFGASVGDSGALLFTRRILEGESLAAESEPPFCS